MGEKVRNDLHGEARRPSVTFVKRTNGLSILVGVPPDMAAKIEERSKSKVRDKARASRAILRALDALADPAKPRRSRSGTIQADVPGELKAELAGLAVARGTDITGVLHNRLSRMIDPDTGKFRTRLRNGIPVRVPPVNYRHFVVPALLPYDRAKKAGELDRLELAVGKPTVGTLRSVLARSRISNALFLTALMQDVIKDLQPAEAGEGDSGPPKLP